ALIIIFNRLQVFFHLIINETHPVITYHQIFVEAQFFLQSNNVFCSFKSKFCLSQVQVNRRKSVHRSKTAIGISRLLTFCQTLSEISNSLRELVLLLLYYTNIVDGDGVIVPFFLKRRTLLEMCLRLIVVF